MKNKLVWAAFCAAVVVSAITIEAVSQAQGPAVLSGVINDYSPQSTTPNGPYLVSGPWSLRLHPQGAEFRASLTMVRSDLSFTTLDPNTEANRNFHTHHIVLNGGTVTPLSNGFQVSGDALITSNGGVPSVLQNSGVIFEITGGTALSPSNMRLTFTGNAVGHFTATPYDGVVALSE